MDQSQTITKKLWHVFQVVYYMLRRSISKKKLMMDLQLLLKRGKIAGRVLGNLISGSNSNSSAASVSGGFSCRSVDPTLIYSPREVEFSCSNTPSYPSLAKRKNRHHNHRDFDYEAAAAIARAFEILNSEVSDAESSVAPSPMKTPAWRRIGRSPAAARQLRITDSPFPIKEDEVADGEVDKEAEEFIRRFYEQLRRQAATPDCYKYRRG